MSIDLRQIQQQQATTAKQSGGGEGAFAFLNRDIKLFSRGISDKKKERFYSGLSILFQSGVDIRSVLDLVEAEQKNKADKAIFGQIREDILKGGTFSDAIEATGKFSPYEYYSLKIGEESGRLSEVLHDLAEYFSGKIEQRRQMVKALSYPVIVFVVAFSAIYFMLQVVVPMFEDVFGRFGGELPALTKFIIDLSEGLGASIKWIGLAIAIVLGVVVTQRKKDWFRSLTAAIALRLPVIGPVVQKIFLARFCHSMNLLLGANTPLVEAIGLVQKMIGFYPLEQSLGEVKEEIMRGASLHQALGKYRVYPFRMISLIKVAEEVNQLDTIFSKLAEQYGKEAEHQSGLLASVLEPMLILFVGFFVAVILIAMYLPLFNLSNSIGM